jgi:hypothetical protein
VGRRGGETHATDRTPALERPKSVRGRSSSAGVLDDDLGDIEAILRKHGIS